MKLKLLIFSLFIAQCILGQPPQSADFILFKKHSQTIGSYHKGDNIAFTNPDKAYIEALITDIKNDSLFLRQFIIQQIPTNLGVYILDTVGSYRYVYHYNQIKAIGRTGPKFNLSGSAASLVGGGALLALASGVVYLADREKFSPPLLIGSLGFMGVGFLMAKVGGKGMIIGKKYKLVYVQVANNKNL
ncbi:MAG: hypothetical protein H7334_06175 [Ferruginibacter sp.]|nr:hypothetical protein [Ferruginibacter sp.]